MREAAADLEFETAARLRDEIKRLRETELAIADDPLARQMDVEDKAGAFAGPRKYGAKANVLSARRSPSPRPSASGERVGVRGSHTRAQSKHPAPHPNPLPARTGRGGSTPHLNRLRARAADLRAIDHARSRSRRWTTWVPAPIARPRARERRVTLLPRAQADAATEMSSYASRPIPGSIRARRPAPSAKRSAARTSPRSTRWARTPSADCRSTRYGRRNPPAPSTSKTQPRKNTATAGRARPAGRGSKGAQTRVMIAAGRQQSKQALALEDWSIPICVAATPQ